ncbi:unnamed protein product, partial [Timema podura]|nr:unnamed protein product [Timema podura]
MQGCPEEMMHIKVSAVSAFAQTLRRYTSLNHLAQAARAVLQNSAQINQMLVDLNRVDFHNVQEQVLLLIGLGRIPKDDGLECIHFLLVKRRKSDNLLCSGASLGEWCPGGRGEYFNTCGEAYKLGG